MFCRILTGATVHLALLSSVWASATLTTPLGVTVSVRDSGSYTVETLNPAWSFGGDVGFPLSNVASSQGSDRLGSYVQLSFDFRSDAPRHAYMRAYLERRAVLFSIENTDAAPNSFSFPSFSQYPRQLKHIAFAGQFAIPTFSGYPDDSPWVFFDPAANAFVLSPAGNFMVSRSFWGPAGELSSGISNKIASLPQGFEHQVLLVVENGINQAFDAWGGALTALGGKTRPPNDADPTLNLVGYWTDAGATYYYRTEPSLSYQETFNAVKTAFDSAGVKLGYVQLDSWFYPKGAGDDWNDRAGGIYQYMAAPQLFPGGLAAFQQGIGAGLVTHSRWLDAASPYRKAYRISGNVATDPLYWTNVAGYLADSGVIAYEQDWLSDRAQTDFDLTDPDAFLGNMAKAMAERHISIQYCMPTTRHLLASSKYGNITTVRAAEDRFDRNRWTNFLYVSRLLSALGDWPFTDNFLSTEQDNLLLAALSAGPVGIGDPAGRISGRNLLKAVRPDGVIVKPDAPLAPLDSSFLDDAQSLAKPMVASTYTDFGHGLRAYYVFAYPQGGDTRAEFQLSGLGVQGMSYVYSYFTGSGYVAGPGDVIDAPIVDGRSYLIVAPVGPSGIAVLGDKGQFVSLGKKRVPALEDDGVARVTVAFADGEGSRILHGYSPAPPAVSAQSGSVQFLSYQADTRRFTVKVKPGADGTAVISLSQPGKGVPVPGTHAGTRSATW